MASNATLLDFDSAALAGWTMALALPTFGYATLFMLGIPLPRIPWLPIDNEYRAPRWLSRLITMVLAFSFFFLLSASLTLKYHTIPPDEMAFRKSYYGEIEPVYLPTVVGRKRDGLERLLFLIDKFDPMSSLRVFVNNKRVFGTHFDCRLEYQCKHGSKQLSSSYLSFIYPVNIPRNMDKPIDLTPFLLEGVNRIDLQQDNSGPPPELPRSLCGMRAQIALMRNDVRIHHEDIAIEVGDYLKFTPQEADNPYYAVCARRQFFVRFERQ